MLRSGVNAPILTLGPRGQPWENASSFPFAIDPAPTHVCSVGPSARYEHASFLGLALVQAPSTPVSSAELFTCWPWRSDAALELRRCGCGATIGWLDEVRVRARPAPIEPRPRWPAAR